MDHFKYSMLREKWRRYFEEGQRDIFDTSSSEESDVKRPTLEENKAYVELFKMSATNVSKDFNITRPDIAFSPVSDEIVHTAVEHNLEQHSDFPKLQLPEMDNDDTTVNGAQQYEHITNAHVQDPMLEQFDSNVETRPQIPQVREDQSRGNLALQGISLGDQPEFAEQQERRVAQLQESMSDQFEFPMSTTRQPDLLQTNSEVYKLEDLAGPNMPMVENDRRSKFARLKNNCAKPRIIIWDTLSQQKPYLMQPFMRRNAQFTMTLPPILEEESETIQVLEQLELEQQLHSMGQKSDLETYQEEPNMEQETESDDSDDEDYEDAQSMDEEQTMVEAYSGLSTAGAQYRWRNQNFHIIVLICIAISLRTIRGNILEELLNYASNKDIIIFMIIFFTLLCCCVLFDIMIFEDKTGDRVNDLRRNNPPVEDAEVPPSRRDEIRGDPEPDRDIQPAVAAPDDTQPMPPEQDMERE